MAGHLASCLFPLGRELSQEEYEDIPRPRLEMYLHVTTKCVQVTLSLAILDHV